MPFPLNERGCRLYSRARHGLWQGVHGLGLRAPDEVLVPAYHCGTEIEALVQAGLTCCFYEATETLEPDAAELDSLVRPNTRALLLIHYFGFPQDAERWRAWCDTRGLLLIEDCAQAWLATCAGRSVGSFGDLAIYSFYKTFALPDGGALHSRSPPQDGAASVIHPGIVAVGKRHVAWAMARSGHLDRLLSRFEHSTDGEEFALGDPRQAPSAATRFLLPRVADARAAERRRQNYRRLLEVCPDSVPSPFARLTDGASPLVFPLELNGRERAVERLERAGIAARPFWPILHPVFPAKRFPVALAWHRRFAALPVHQELRAGDVDRIAAALRDVTSNG